MIDNTIRKMTDRLTEFLRLESDGGLLIAAAAILALIRNNSPLRQAYDDLLKIAVEMRFGSFAIAKPLLLWINDGLMAILSLLVGLEVKREVLEGELSTPAQIVLPVVAGSGNGGARSHLLPDFPHRRGGPEWLGNRNAGCRV